MVQCAWGKERLRTQGVSAGASAGACTRMPGPGPRASCATGPARRQAPLLVCATTAWRLHATILPRGGAWRRMPNLPPGNRPLPCHKLPQHQLSNQCHMRDATLFCKQAPNDGAPSLPCPMRRPGWPDAERQQPLQHASACWQVQAHRQAPCRPAPAWWLPSHHGGVCALRRTGKSVQLKRGWYGMAGAQAGQRRVAARQSAGRRAR